MISGFPHSFPDRSQCLTRHLFPFIPLILIILISTALLSYPAAADDMVRQVDSFHPPFFAEFQDVEIANGRVYIFGVGGMGIVDQATLSFIGRYEPPGGRLFKGAIAGIFAYAGAREDLLHVIDMTNELNPLLVVTHGAAGSSYEGIAVYGGYLYAARHSEGIEVMNLDNPAVPYTVAEVTGLSNSWDLAFQGDYAFVADGGGGLAVLDISDPTSAQHIYSRPTSGAASDVDVAGGLALVACGSAGVDVFDLSNPADAQWVGNYNSPGLAIILDAVGDKLFVADWDNLEVVDLSSPVSPSRIGWENTRWRAMGLAADGDRAYVADWGILQAYEFGPTFQGDIDLPFREITFDAVPVGDSAQTTFPVINTGGAPLNVTSVQTFNSTFTIEPPTSFVVAPDAVHEVTLTFTPDQPGFDATFVRIDSDDPDEPDRSFPCSADDDPFALDIREEAPGFTFQDMDGVTHNLSDYLGKVVVLAFFANW